MISARTSARPHSVARRSGFTLIELLTATALALFMMLILANVFAIVSDSINEQRAGIEIRGRMRGVVQQIQRDLEGVTVRMEPPVDPAWNEGYFEYIEGPFGPIFWPQRPYPAPPGMQVVRLTDPLPLQPSSVARDIDPDTTLGDNDDILMFTTRSRGAPFTGRGGQSLEAEVAYFIRGTTLYRRQLLVGTADPAGVFDKNFNSINVSLDPATASGTTPVNYNAYFSSPPTDRQVYFGTDFSVRYDGGASDPVRNSGGERRFVLNSLSDLTDRKNRFAHQPRAFPHDVRNWGPLRLPTLVETSHKDWMLPDLGGSSVTLDTYPSDPSTDPNRFVYLPAGIGTINVTLSRSLTLSQLPRAIIASPTSTGFVLGFNVRSTPHPFTQLEQSTGNILAYAQRTANTDKLRGREDVVLENVLAFDVKAWDPGAPVYLGVNGNSNSPKIQPGDPAYLAKVNSATPIGYGAYVDLNYMCLKGGPTNTHLPTYSAAVDAPIPAFHHCGDPRSWLAGQLPPNGSITVNTASPLSVLASIYDTGSTSGEYDGFDQNRNGTTDEGANGVDDDGTGGIDDAGEKEAPPPYSAPLRGIQIRLRVYEPETGAIREATIVQDFIRE